MLSTTSSFTVSDLAAEKAPPQRLGGWHPFTPVERRPFVEIAVSDRIAPSVVAAAHWLTDALGHQAIEVRRIGGQDGVEPAAINAEE